MRCHVCDRAMTEAEIQPSPSGKGYEPCAVCMEIILDAAYSDGFVRPDDDEVPYLEEGEHRTELDRDLIHLFQSFEEGSYD